MFVLKNLYQLPINFKQLRAGRKDEINSLLNQFWRLVSGPLTLIFIPLFLSNEDQGFWYTFIGISALSIFADLGFTAIILQFSAHEFAFLKFENGELVGNEYHLARISSLFRFVLRWTTIVVLIVFPIIAIIGIIMFSDKSETNFWLLPWIIYLIASVGNFSCSVISSFVQGCQQVAKIQRIMLFSSAASTIVLIPLLYFHFGLYALALSLTLGVTVFILLLNREYNTLFIQLLKHDGSRGNWRRELLPLLGKYAVSWASGYFCFQIYTPLMFQYKGAVAAGKVGITITLISAIYSISNVWFIAKTPKLNILVAERKWLDLDVLFKNLVILSASTYLLGISTLLAAFVVLSGNWNLFDKISERFLGLIPVSMLALGWFFQIFVSGSAAYLRAHKKEVYMYVSLFSGLFIVVTTFLSARYLPVEYLFTGFLASYFIFGIIEYRIFRQSRILWHST